MKQPSRFSKRTVSQWLVLLNVIFFQALIFVGVHKLFWQTLGIFALYGIGNILIIISERQYEDFKNVK